MEAGTFSGAERAGKGLGELVEGVIHRQFFRLPGHFLALVLERDQEHRG
ncbi:hypothetical protein [Nonomuraea purpurea]